MFRTYYMYVSIMFFVWERGGRGRVAKDILSIQSYTTEFVVKFLWMKHFFFLLRAGEMIFIIFHHFLDVDHKFSLASNNWVKKASAATETERNERSTCEKDTSVMSMGNMKLLHNTQRIFLPLSSCIFNFIHIKLVCEFLRVLEFSLIYIRFMVR